MIELSNGNNYTYTALGELASDREEGIDTILWRPDGKIRKIIYEASTGKDNLEFQYDAMGNRIAKLIKDGSDSLIKATYYVRDAQGNVMTVYQWQINDTLPEHIAIERTVYGSSRLGVETTPVEMIGAMPQTQDTAVRFLQYKHYEISNHLGNVLAVVSDKKVLKDTDQNMLVDEYHPDMVSAHDYSPFGVHLYGRSYVRPEGGDTIPNDFNSWQVAWSPSDASLVVNANNELEVTAYADYKGAWFDLPTKPGQEYHVTLNIDMGNAGSVSYGAYGNGGNPLAYAEISQGGVVKFTFIADNTSTQIAVLMVHSNGPETFKVVSATYQEYEAAYRYGFNGQEKDDEIKGGGNSISYTHRMHDTRIGRFLSMDPLVAKYPYYSPYIFSGNRVIDAVELEGLQPDAIFPRKMLETGEIVLKSQNEYGVFDRVQATYTAFVYFHYNQTGEEPSSEDRWLYYGAAVDIEFQKSGLADKVAILDQINDFAGASKFAKGFVKRQVKAGIQKKVQKSLTKKIRIGKAKNKREPNKEADGDHSTFNERGNTTYKKNEKNPSGFDEVKRVDTKGGAHKNKDGKDIPTPHVHEKGKKDVRPAVKGKDY